MRYTIARLIYRNVKRLQRLARKLKYLYDTSDCKTSEAYEHISGLHKNY